LKPLGSDGELVLPENPENPDLDEQTDTFDESRGEIPFGWLSYMAFEPLPVEARGETGYLGDLRGPTRAVGAEITLCAELADELPDETNDSATMEAETRDPMSSSNPESIS